MRRTRTARAAGFAMLVAVAVAGCGGDRPKTAEPAVVPAAPSTAPVAAPTTASTPTTPATTTSATPTAPGTQSATFVAVVDGDTVQTSEGVVRLIGIDTPEKGDCGHEAASTAIGRLVSPGDPVTLELPAGENERDQHDRLLRYVATAGGVDLGLMQLEAGNAIARYDSTDGYPQHPKQAAYHAAQIAAAGPNGSVNTLACQEAARTSAAPTPTPTEATAEDPWWRQYASCAKLKKNTAGHPTGPFRRDNPSEAAIYQWFAEGTGFRGDGDNDGLACE